MYEKLVGFDELTDNQKKDFSQILNMFLGAQGTEARENLVLKSVKSVDGCFRLDFSRYGKPTYTTLNHKTQEWG